MKNASPRCRGTGAGAPDTDEDDAATSEEDEGAEVAAAPDDDGVMEPAVDDGETPEADTADDDGGPRLLDGGGVEVALPEDEDDDAPAPARHFPLAQCCCAVQLLSSLQAPASQSSPQALNRRTVSSRARTQPPTAVSTRSPAPTTMRPMLSTAPTTDKAGRPMPVARPPYTTAVSCGRSVRLAASSAVSVS